MSEALRSVPRRDMVLLERFDQLERRAKHCVQRIGVMLRGVEPAAHRRPTRRKRRNHKVSTWLHRIRCRLCVRSLIVGGGQEMKDGSIVPRRQRAIEDDRARIGYERAHARILAELPTQYVDCGCRNVDCDDIAAISGQSGHERRGASTQYCNHISRRRHAAQRRESGLRKLLEPTDLGRLFGGPDLVPVLLNCLRLLR
jgi:hypothetical protein